MAKANRTGRVPIGDGFRVLLGKGVMMKVKWIIGLLVGAGAVLCGTGHGGEIFREDFDGYITGQPPVPPWQEVYDAPAGGPYTRQEAENLGVTIQVVDSVCFSPPNSLHILDTSGSVHSRLWRTFSPTSSEVVVEYLMRTHNDGYEGAFVALNGDVAPDCQAVFSNGAFGGSPGWIGVHGSLVGWMYPNLLQYSVDTWYYVRRELNLTTNVGRFYVEELLDGHDLGDPGNASNEYSVGSDRPNSYVNVIEVSSSGSQGADCYIDDIVVTPEPATLSLLALGGLALLRRRRGYGA